VLVNSGSALAKRDRLIVGPLRLTHKEEEDTDQEEGGKQETQRADPAAPTAGRAHFDGWRVGRVDTVRRKRFVDRGIPRQDRLGVIRAWVEIVDPQRLTGFADGKVLYLATRDIGRDGGKILGGRRVVAVDHQEPERNDGNDQDEPDRAAAQSSYVTHEWTSQRPILPN